jgi:VanZ family protein
MGIRILRWLPALIWMGVIFYWSSQSALPIDDVPNNDAWHKLGHIAEFAILAMLLALALGTRPRFLIVACAVALVNGIVDEFHQSFVPGRHAQVETVVLDSVVAGVTLIIVWLGSSRLRRSRAPGDWQAAKGRSHL